MDTFIFTWEQLYDLLADFRERCVFDWISDKEYLTDMDAVEYFIKMKRKDPCWPDRPPQER